MPMLVRLLAGVGDGVAGPMLDSLKESLKVSLNGELRLRGDEPKLGRRPGDLPPFETAL